MPWWHWDLRHQHQYNIYLNMLSKTLLIFLQLLLQTLLSLPPHTTRPWCEITGQDQASRIRSRGDIGKASGTNNPPTTHLSITDILMFHAHCEWISGCDWIGCIWAVPESWLALPGKRLQRCNLCSTTPSGSQTQYLPWWDRGGSPMAPALRQMETTMLPEIDVLQWAQGVTAYCSTSLLL